MIYLPEWGPVLDVLAYRSEIARVVLNGRGRPLVLWVPLDALRVVP